jgi:hypothetical protein
MWSFGIGANRIYCGIARTEDGFAVDVFRGDTCIESLEFGTQAEALKGAAEFERQYVRQPRRVPPMRTPEADTLAAHG